eukprot:CAMPEP_0179012596 /NCGR_PEP_ID=MMETSP0796-20121207/1287_1 /TAXON_ID=73915 /ORGANISM="Pyrodinium bahamense, Strain pbaha01" /LENGTH=71 /DNA_ID=CAMNT_0020708063 /DNA_START=48 /DNA_END=264 /DNA_ORIENTATION=-
MRGCWLQRLCVTCTWRYGQMAKIEQERGPEAHVVQRAVRSHLQFLHACFNPMLDCMPRMSTSSNNPAWTAE